MTGKRATMHTSRPVESPFLTTREAANYLRVSERTLQNWRYANLGPIYRKHVGIVVYHVEDLLRFSESGHRPGKAHYDT